MENGNEPAFATPDNGTEFNTTWQGQKSLTKREYFSGLAMQGILSSPEHYTLTQGAVDVAKRAIDCADELLKQLDK